MYKIVVKLRYEYAHRLIHHQGNCRNIHGHSGQAIIAFAADQLNANGFVMDFGEIKPFIKKWLNENWDHAYLANENDLLLPRLREFGMKIFTFPAEPSAEIMAKFLFEQIAQMQLNAGVKLISVTIKETCTGYATYER